MVNSTIGAGIFGLPSKIFGLSGIYSIPAFFLCGLIVFILVLNFAEVSSRFKKTGGPYLYTLTAFGRFPAFLMGWLILITRLATYAALVNLFVTYTGYFHPILQESFAKTILIIGITVFFTIINYIGIRNTVVVSNILAISKLVPLFIFVIVGMFFINPELINLKQELPDLPSFSKSIFLLVFAFTGFEAIVVNTGEMKNPRHNLPFALMLSIGFVAIFYSFIQFVSIGTLPGLAGSEKPLADAAIIFMGPVGGLLITAGAIVSISGTLNTVMLIGSRLPFALSEEKQFPKIFSYIHKTFKTPTRSLILFSLVSLFVSLSGSFIYAVTISVISKVLILLIVSLALIKLRRDKPEERDYFKIPFGYGFAITGVLLSIWLLSSSKPVEFRDVLLTMFAGAILYIIFKFKSLRKNLLKK